MKGDLLSVAVRSSSTVEDLDQASFASQYETFLHIHSETENYYKKRKNAGALPLQIRCDIIKKIGKSVREGNMAIIIQGLIDSKVSGVAFSKDPITNEKDKVS